MNFSHKLNETIDGEENCGNRQESSDTNFAEKSLKFISIEASKVDKELRRFSYKHPLAVMTAGLAAGYVTHWILNRQSSQKNE